ncbi:MAG: hypothetical protein DHS20C05_21980 [Hyphococcus sp.]|nr:MAG: hypothetical protein DHS20C05_21980 [Marinicaulis sp.]
MRAGTKTYYYRVCVGLILSATSLSCAPQKAAPSLTADFQDLQVRTIDASPDQAFEVILSTCKNLGYEIETANQETGWITLTSSPKKHVDWFVTGSKYTTRNHAKIFVEPISNDISRVHVTFMTDTEYNNWYKQEPLVGKIVMEKDIYDEIFEEILGSIIAKRE